MMCLPVVTWLFIGILIHFFCYSGLFTIITWVWMFNSVGFKTLLRYRAISSKYFAGWCRNVPIHVIKMVISLWPMKAISCWIFIRISLLDILRRILCFFRW